MRSLLTIAAALISCGAHWHSTGPGDMGSLTFTATIETVRELSIDESQVSPGVYVLEMRAIERDQESAREYAETWMVWGGSPTVTVNGGIQLSGKPGLLAMRLDQDGPLYAARE